MFALIHKWHRKIGIFAATFLLLLIGTGIVINHSEQIGFNTSYIKQNWLLDWYNIDIDSEPFSFAAGSIRVTQIGNRLYVNDKEIANNIEQLIGLQMINGYFVIAYDHSLLLITKSAEAIEILSGEEGVPSGMKRVGIAADGQLVIEAAHGFYVVDLDELQWHEQNSMQADWSLQSDVPEDVLNILKDKYRGTGLSYERVLLDVHSGRIMGQWGVYFVDAIALLLAFIGLSGIWMWFKRLT